MKEADVDRFMEDNKDLMADLERAEEMDKLRKRLADAEDVLREIHRKLEALRTGGEGIAHKVIRHQARDYFERWS